jgi:hypothetical protein
MTCEQSRHNLLELGWTANQRRGAIESLRHLEQCADCQAAVAEYEKIHETLRAPAEIDAPVGGWEQFERRQPDNRHIARDGAAIRWRPGAGRRSIRVPTSFVCFVHMSWEASFNFDTLVGH